MLLSRPVGIDVSSFQGSINWTSVKNAGKSFAFIRAATGRTSLDSQFHANATNALAAGLYIGYYYYAYYDDAGHTPTGDADAYWNTIYNPGGTHYIAADGKHLMPVVDIEESTAPSNGETLSHWTYDFCERLKSDAAAVGFNITPMVYTNQNFAQSKF